MVGAISQQAVSDFFGRYRAAFDALDGDAVADLWHVPCAIAIASAHADDAQARATWWHDDAPMRDYMRAMQGAPP